MRVSIQSRPSNAGGLGRAALALARTLALTPHEAKLLLAGRNAIPAVPENAEALAAALNDAGCKASAHLGPAAASSHCGTHLRLESEARCRECQAAICAVCVLAHGEPICADDWRKLLRRRQFRNLRVGMLLLVLLGVGGWVLVRSRQADARTQWIRTLSASVVLVAEQPISSKTQARWRHGVASLQSWFEREWARYRAPAPLPMIALSLDGAVQVDALPALPGAAKGLPERAAELLAFKKALAAIDANTPAHARPDLTIYVFLRPNPAEGAGMVEGVAEAGGIVGVVGGVLDTEDLALELTALGHELLHCLGATDKYDPQGHAVLPQGLAEPDLSPVFPQHAAEVMVGEIPTGPASGKPLKRLDEVQVGPATAREIHWQ